MPDRAALQVLLAQPTAQATVADMTRQIVQRSAARTFKLVLASRAVDGGAAGQTARALE